MGGAVLCMVMLLLIGADKQNINLSFDAYGLIEI